MKKILTVLLMLALCAMPMSALAANKAYDCSSGVCKKTKNYSRCTGSSCPQAGTTTKVNGTSNSSMASSVIAQTNAERAKRGLNQLSTDGALTAAACTRAKEIVSQFSHTRPNGQRGITACNSCRGENIAKGQQNADKVMAAWLSSDGHKRTLMNSSYTKIGVCAYQVNGIMYWVQLFA